MLEICLTVQATVGRAAAWRRRLSALTARAFAHLLGDTEGRRSGFFREIDCQNRSRQHQRNTPRLSEKAPFSPAILSVNPYFFK